MRAGPDLATSGAHGVTRPNRGRQRATRHGDRAAGVHGGRDGAAGDGDAAFHRSAGRGQRPAQRQRPDGKSRRRSKAGRALNPDPPRWRWRARPLAGRPPMRTSGWSTSRWSGSEAAVAQASQLAGSGSIPAPCSRGTKRGAGMLPEPAGRDACATFPRCLPAPLPRAPSGGCLLILIVILILILLPEAGDLKGSLLTFDPSSGRVGCRVEPWQGGFTPPPRNNRARRSG